MKISLVLLLVCLGCSVAQDEFSTKRSKRTAHFLLHQFADILGYDIIPKVAVVADIRTRLGLPPLPSLAQPQGQMPQGQPPQTQAPPRTSTMGTSTTRAGGSSTPAQPPPNSPATPGQAPPNPGGPLRLPLPLNILNRLEPTVPIINPPVPPQSIPTAVGGANRLEQPQPEVGLQHTNFSLNYIFTRVPQNPTSPAPSASGSVAAPEAPSGPSGPSAEAPSAEAGDPSLDGPTRFFDDNNFVFNPRDANDDEFDTNLAFNGWRPPMPDEFNLAEESSELKFNPAPTTRSVGGAPAKLDPVSVAYPNSIYINVRDPPVRPVHRRRSATSQLTFSNKGSQYGYVTYHQPQFQQDEDY